MFQIVANMAHWAFFPLIIITILWSLAHIHIWMLGGFGLNLLSTWRTAAILAFSSFFGVYNAISVIQIIYFLNMSIIHGENNMDAIGKAITLVFAIGSPITFLCLHFLVRCSARWMRLSFLIKLFFLLTYFILFINLKELLGVLFLW